jgi:hypothetical protein
MWNLVCGEFISLNMRLVEELKNSLKAEKRIISEMEGSVPDEFLNEMHGDSQHQLNKKLKDIEFFKTQMIK